jgi:DNA invertase Pin-like site-specific DNA recombinase
MLRFRQMKTLQKFASVHASVHNHFNSERHLVDRQTYKKVGCEKTFEDKKSGAKTDRPGLASALDYARAGDQLVVWRLDPLGRSLPDLIALVRQLDDKGVQLRSVDPGCCRDR